MKTTCQKGSIFRLKLNTNKSTRLMGEKKMKITDVARATGVNRGTITRLYHETAVRVELDTIDRLCQLLDCEVGDLLEHIGE